MTQVSAMIRRLSARRIAPYFCWLRRPVPESAHPQPLHHIGRHDPPDAQVEKVLHAWVVWHERAAWLLHGPYAATGIGYQHKKHEAGHTEVTPDDRVLGDVAQRVGLTMTLTHAYNMITEHIRICTNVICMQQAACAWGRKHGRPRSSAMSRG
jgi:hypothetical protein